MKKPKKEPHVIAQKRFVFRVPRTGPRKGIGNKEMRLVRREVASHYRRWQERYLKKRGVIGPDGHPSASYPKVSADGWELVVGLKADFIVHRYRAAWEKFLRRIHPKSIAITVAGLGEWRKGDGEPGKEE